MSKLHEELTSEAAGESLWYLQVAADDLYGPVSLSDLQSWARQGRIAPDNQVSRDRKRWTQAADVPALGMDWIVDLPDGGTYGPVCGELIPELVKRGLIEPDLTAENRRTGARQVVARFAASGRAVESGKQPELPLDALFPEVPASDSGSESGDPSKDIAPPERPPPADDLEADSVSDPAAPASQTDTTPSADPAPAGKAQPQLDDAASESGNQEALAQRLQTLQRSAREARKQLAEARRELTRQRADNNTLQDRMRKLEDDLQAAEKLKRQSEHALTEQADRAARAETDIENLQAQIEQLQNHYDRLQVEFQEQFELLDRTRADFMELEQTSNQERVDFNTRLKTKTGLLQQAIRCILRDPDVQDATLPEHLLETPREQWAMHKLTEQLDLARELLHKAEARHAEEAETRSRGKWGAGLYLVLVVVLLAFAVWVGNRSGRRQVLRGGGALMSGAHAAARHVPVQPVPVANRRESAAPYAVVSDWPRIELPRTQLRTGDRELAIVFTYGLFERGSLLSEQGAADLELLAERVRPHLDRFSLVVEGHTDAVPVSSPDGRYVDNFALGMARATAVTQMLQHRHGIPESAMFATSAGESDPPYPNDTDESRRRNRTVVVKLIPKR